MTAISANELYNLFARALVRRALGRYRGLEPAASGPVALTDARWLGELLERPPGLRYALAGGVATRRYQRERPVGDIDVVVAAADLEEAETRLAQAGLTPLADDRGHPGSSWGGGKHLPVDLMVLQTPWVDEALAEADHTRDLQQLAVLPLPFQVLLKLPRDDDQQRWDVARMLTFARREHGAQVLSRVRGTVARHAPEHRRTLETLIWLGRVEIGP